MTQIFKTHEDFLKREDKKINGISPDFANANPNYEQDNKTNAGCWNCIDCTGCTGSSNCESCIRCRNCQNCSDCYACQDLVGASNIIN